jgi:Family of unknown function (DUF5343)
MPRSSVSRSSSVSPIPVESRRQVLGEAIREGYADLFAVYPDANQRSQADLDHVFSTSSSGGKQVIGKTVSTFKALAEQADFPPLNEQTECIWHPVPFTRLRPRLRPRVYGRLRHARLFISTSKFTSRPKPLWTRLTKHLYGAKKAE